MVLEVVPSSDVASATYIGTNQGSSHGVVVENSNTNGFWGVIYVEDTKPFPKLLDNDSGVNVTPRLSKSSVELSIDSSEELKPSGYLTLKLYSLSTTKFSIV